jgi:hypothetical protein
MLSSRSKSKSFALNPRLSLVVPRLAVFEGSTGLGCFSLIPAWNKTLFLTLLAGQVPLSFTSVALELLHVLNPLQKL